jgi:uncharacterized protein YuzE
MRSIVLPLLWLCTSASAQEPAAPGDACATLAQPWRAARSLVSARDAAGAAQARFAPGEPVRLALHPDSEVAYLTLPQGEGEAASFGGMASFTVAQAGTYRIGLAEPVWIDVVQNGKPAEAVRFGPGPACSGIRKAVSFDLAPGPHVLEISGGTVPEVAVLVEPLP